MCSKNDVKRGRVRGLAGILESARGSLHCCVSRGKGLHMRGGRLGRRIRGLGGRGAGLKVRGVGIRCRGRVRQLGLRLGRAGRGVALRAEAERVDSGRIGRVGRLETSNLDCERVRRGAG